METKNRKSSQKSTNKKSGSKKTPQVAETKPEVEKEQAETEPFEFRLKFKSSFFEEPISLSKENQLLVGLPDQNPLLDEATQVRQIELSLKAHTSAILDAATGGYRLSDTKIEQILLCLENIKRLRLKFSILVQSWIGKYLKTQQILLQSLASSNVTIWVSRNKSSSFAKASKKP